MTVRVLGDSLVQHFIHGAKVMEYSRLRLDNGTPLKEGYLSVQAEGTSTQFRKLEVLDLVGCMDRTNPAYRSYYVKNDPAACATTSSPGGVAPDRAYRLLTRDGGWVVEGDGDMVVDLRGLDGSRLAGSRGAGAVRLPGGLRGVYQVQVRGAAGSRVWRGAFP